LLDLITYNVTDLTNLGIVISSMAKLDGDALTVPDLGATYLGIADQS